MVVIRMDRPVLVLIHAPWETPALVDTALADIPTVRRTVLDEASPVLPSISELGGLVVMGGPQDANDDERHPGLRVERRLLADAVSADVPVLGICLGMQLLALALGSELHLRHGKEVGFARVELTHQGAFDPTLGVFAEREHTTFLHWHSDAVELPNGATLLASTPRTPVQAFRIGSALGVQFHPEADAALLAKWLETPTMVSGLAAADIALIRRDGEAHLPSLRATALIGFDAFVMAVRNRRGQ
jgi:GMP synthase (glutamine-hydrolysing)